MSDSNFKYIKYNLYKKQRGLYTVTCTVYSRTGTNEKNKTQENVKLDWPSFAFWLWGNRYLGHVI